LAEIASIHNANHATERKTKDDAFHFALLRFAGRISKAIFVPERAIFVPESGRLPKIQ
jgi:hypothetical protein